MWNVIICSYVLLIYLIVTFGFIGIDISQSKYIGVCIQGKELFVLLYSYINFCIMTGWTCIERMCHITIYLDTYFQSMHNKILYYVCVKTFIFIVTELINTCCGITHPLLFNGFICILYYHIISFWVIFFFLNTYLSF